MLSEKTALPADKHFQDVLRNYQDLLDNTNDAVIKCDPEDTVISWNRGAEIIFGWKAGEITGKKLLPLLVPSRMQAEAMNLIRDAISGRTVTGINTVRLHRDGSTGINVELTVFPARGADQNVTGMTYVIRDLTEQRRVESALKESEARLQALVKSAPDAIVLTDKGGNITSWNTGAQAVFQYSQEEVTGKPLTMLIPARHLSSHEKGIKLMTSTGEFHTIGKKIEVHGIKKDGNEVPLEFSPAAWNTGTAVFYGGIIRDLSERKRAEELRFKIMRLERLAEEKKAKELHLENTRFTLTNKAEVDFLSSISHELRIPLNSIIGFSELLKQGVQSNLNDKQKQYVEHILSSGRYLLEFIDNLDLRVLEPGKIQLVVEKMPVAETTGEVFALLKERAEKQNVILKKDIDPLMDIIEADRRMFKQILFNLMGNAVKFSKKEGGIVTVTAKRTGDTARFSVVDTGIGIMGGDMAKIFNKGTGLAVSKKLVELHGGTLTVESRYGEGSTFAFQLPVTAIKKQGK